MADNEFRSGVQRELCRLMGTRQLFSAPYRPSTNGLCERVHAFAQSILQNCIANAGDTRDWDEYLPAIRFAIVTSRLDGLGFSPYQLLFGRRARLPVDTLMPFDAPGVSHDLKDWFHKHLEALSDIRAKFDYSQQKCDARMRIKRDKRQNRRPATLQVGDLVYHTREYYNQDPVQRGLAKLLGKWAGPSKITKLLGENTYEVEVAPGKTMIFNVQYLSPYQGEDPPTYRPRPTGLLDGLKGALNRTTPRTRRQIQN